MIQVFDFFSGCGGTSLGFQNLGFEIIGALDSDRDSSHTYRHNFPDAHFIERDIRGVNEKELFPFIKKTKRIKPLLFCGCAPCQPFSNQRTTKHKNDYRKTLLHEFQRFIVFWRPDFIFLENVPGIQNIKKSNGAFENFLETLNSMNYKIDYATVTSSQLGVPQTRKRFILVASKPKHHLKSIQSVLDLQDKKIPNTRDFIEDLPALEAGESHPTIPNHTAAKLSPINLLRIKNTPEGGDRRDWPKNLLSGCHKSYSGHTDVYGRMSWDKLSSTLTTKCTSYSNGRFGHPEQNRGITVREAARLQTFPDSFIFCGPLTSCARQVGNAVPPLMAEVISKCFRVK